MLDSNYLSSSLFNCLIDSSKASTCNGKLYDKRGKSQAIAYFLILPASDTDRPAWFLLPLLAPDEGRMSETSVRRQFVTMGDS